jgi:dolichyl-phosphate-mannose--protein O-mannosyl transferase
MASAFGAALMLLLAVSQAAFAKDTQEVTCGSVIKLVHEETRHKLHSHDIAYGSGSGQQSVTGFEGSDDANSYWVVKGLQVRTRGSRLEWLRPIS